MSSPLPAARRPANREIAMTDHPDQDAEDAARRERKRATRRAWEKANRERINERKRGRLADPEARAKKNAQQRAWRLAHREAVNEKKRHQYATDPQARAKKVEYNRARHLANREQINEARRYRYATDADFRKSNRDSALHRKYGLSPQDYDRMFKRQRGLCAMCWKRKRPLCVDHSHDPHMVRALLCRHCNIGFGNFFENSTFLRRAADYGDFFKAHQKEILRGDPAVLQEAARLKEALLSIDMSSLLPPPARAGRASGARAKPPPRNRTAGPALPTMILQPAKPERKKKHTQRRSDRRQQSRPHDAAHDPARAAQAVRRGRNGRQAAGGRAQPGRQGRGRRPRRNQGSARPHRRQAAGGGERQR
ncbi:MAG: hypothetical protein C5B46_09250 [Proteobacteria bacterium]|nr:MAG: hypothetical protein C5B46_09250 [Pseudomonadota bacterium]